MLEEIKAKQEELEEEAKKKEEAIKVEPIIKVLYARDKFCAFFAMDLLIYSFNFILEIG